MKICGNCKKTFDDSSSSCPYCGANASASGAASHGDGTQDPFQGLLSNIPSFADIMSGGSVKKSASGTAKPSAAGSARSAGAVGAATGTADEGAENPDEMSGDDCNRVGMDYTLARRGKPMDFAMATEWFQRGAERGNASAMYNLASNYLNGKGTEKNFKAAAEWYQRAVELGSASAANDLGNMYQHGYGVPADGKRAFELYSLADERGSKAAACNLGYCYDHGIGVERSLEKAFALYKKAADNGSAGGANNVAYMYENGAGVEKNPEEAFRWYKLAHLRGSTAAANNAGNMLRLGKLGKPDAPAALEWYLKGIEKGNASSMYSAGVMYYNGADGIPQDPAKAFRFFTQAAEAGNASAQNDLGHMYQQGTGVDKNPELALYWYRAAAKSGSIAANNNLGYCYDNGIGTSVDHARALFYYRVAAEGRSYVAKNNLAYAYEMGNGVERDLGKALKLYSAASDAGSRTASENLKRLKENRSLYTELNRALAALAESGDGEAAFCLSEVYSIGRGVDIDDEKAFECLLRSANLGYSEAYPRLAVAYLYGIGTEASAKDARAWFSKAKEYCEDKLKNAQLPRLAAYSAYALGEMYNFGLGVEADELAALEMYKRAAQMGSIEAHNRCAIDAPLSYKLLHETVPSDDRFEYGNAAPVNGHDAETFLSDGKFALGYYDGFLIIDNKYMLTPRMIHTAVLDTADKRVTLLLKQPVLFGDDSNSFTITFESAFAEDTDADKLVSVAEHNGVNVRYL